VHVAAVETKNAPLIPAGLEFEPGEEVLLGGEVGQSSPVRHRPEHGGDSWGGIDGWGAGRYWVGGWGWMGRRLQRRRPGT
jgi:hypothetical protein